VPDPVSSPGPNVDEPNLPIARAGSLLTEQGLRPKVGSATILAPGEPASVSIGAASASPKKSGQGGAAPKATKSQDKKPADKAISKPKAATPAKPNMSVILVNETGRSQVGEDYRLVLSRIGYNVLAVSERGLSGNSGQTVITYQSGRQGQARSLARRLPGPRRLEASSGPLPAEAVVIIR
jgi:hypothetical protein